MRWWGENAAMAALWASVGAGLTALRWRRRKLWERLQRHEEQLEAFTEAWEAIGAARAAEPDGRRPSLRVVRR